MSQEEEKQVNTLLYCLGEEAGDVFAACNATDKAKKVYAEAVHTFERFFGVRKNLIFERARFNSRDQMEGESTEQYLLVLHALARNCEYGQLRDELIRDRIVIGILDKALSKRLQMDPELTLEKAARLVRQSESVGEQQQVLKGQKDSELDVNWMTSKSKAAQQLNPSSSCTRCGNQHEPGKCPAQKVTCFRCHKRGHFKSQCFSQGTSQKVADKEVDSVKGEAVETVFLGTVGEGEGSWMAKISVCGQCLPFKIDTGADVTAISEEGYKRIKGKGGKLVKPSKLLRGPSNQPLPVVGEFIGSLAYEGKSEKHQIFVVKGLKNNLLGLPAIRSMGLVVRVSEVTSSYKDKILVQYPALFRGLGTLGEPYEIKLKRNSKPVSLFAPRRVPIPLRKQVQTELDQMEALGVISKVDIPTPWCAGMVVAQKPNGAIRICVDLKPLNECVLREVYPLPSVDEILAQISGSKVFSKLDANSGFWQIPLAPSSRLLTTFVTPFGRYHFNKLPFGISSAPELFQKRMSNVLSGVKGSLCLIDDVLVFGKTQGEHDQRLADALKRIQSAGVTLNKDKCVFSTSTLTFLGHVLDKDGISADPEKTSAIRMMDQPNNVSELRRFMGMLNQMGKFSPNLASITQPLRELLSTKSTWTWGPAQDEAFKMAKAELTKPTILSLYDPGAETKLSSDASSYGLGAVLLQLHQGGWKPVVYASRSLSETERRYAQIEKEALAITWACEKFSEYILGKQILIETDHKPLVPLLSSKHLDDLPPRVLRFRLRLMRFAFSIVHVPGKYMYTADALSRAPTGVPVDNCAAFQKEVEGHIAAVTEILPATKQQLDKYRCAQAADSDTGALINYCKFGWPVKTKLSPNLKSYWTVRGRLKLHDDLLLYGSRIVIPQGLRQETMQKIHQGHQGILKCRLRVESAVWWPGVSNEVEDFVKQCYTCSKRSTPPVEPMIASELPDYPWQKVGADLFELKGIKYLLLVDYFSRYIEVVKLSATTSGAIISVLKAIFSRYSIPERLISDNGPQFASREMKIFSVSYGFEHVTSSPHYPQGNGQAERAVQTAKRLLSAGDDSALSLLSYRTTAMPWCGYSPAELLMGRRLRTQVPQLPKQFIPNWPHIESLKELHGRYKYKQKDNYDTRHRAHGRPDLSDGSEVWVAGGGDGDPVPGQVMRSADTPRSYFVSTPSGQVRRSSRHLVTIPDREGRPDAEHQPSQEVEQDVIPELHVPVQAPVRGPIMTRSKTGTKISCPVRYQENQ